MALEIYKKNQGIYARIALGSGLGILAMMAAYSLYGSLIELPELYPNARVPLFDIPFTWGVFISAVFFIFSAFLAAALTTGAETGVRLLDANSKKVVDFLIDTQGELQKVAWPTREELTGSTAVVIISIVVLGAYIFAVDWVITRIMRLIGFI